MIGKDYILRMGGGLILLAGVAGIMTSCSDKDDIPAPDFSSKTFTGTALELYYNGEQMPGKTADVRLADGKADISFTSTLDLSQVEGLGLNEKLVCPGVLPGNLKLDLTTPITPGNGCYTLSGSGETQEVSYSYAGEIYSDKMVFNLTDVKLKVRALAGKVFAPAPLKTEYLNIISSPFHIVWELDPTAGIDVPLSGLLEAIAVAPIIPVYNNTAYMSAAEAFTQVIKTIALLDSGNIPVMYVSTLGGAAHIATTCGNMLQYVPTASGLNLYVNPLSLYSQFLLAASNNKDDAQFDFAAMLHKAPTRTDASAGNASGEIFSQELKIALLKSVLTALAPQIAEGIPLTISPTDKGVALYFDTATSVTFLANVLGGMLQNPSIAAALQQKLASLELPGLTPEQMQAILADLPGFLEKTTRLELGLELIAQ